MCSTDVARSPTSWFMHPIDMIHHWARAAPHRPAIIQPDMVITYGGLRDTIAAVSERIGQYQFDPAQPVAVSIENSAKLLAVCLALIGQGFVVAPVTQSAFPFLRSFGIDNVIYTGSGPVLSGGKSVRFEDSWLAPGPRHSAKPLGIRRTYGSAVFFTSGTTGRPKQIVNTPENLMHRLSLPRLAGDADYSRILILPGINAQWGFVYACQAFRDGRAACFAPIGEPSLRLVSSFQVDLMLASIEQLAAFVAAQEKSGRHPMESVKSIITGGSVTTRDFIRRVQSVLCRKIYIHYASTEAGLAASGAFDLIEHVPSAVGFPTPWTELEIVDEDGNVLPAGAEGRVRYRTEMYLRNIGADPGRPGDHWYYPGDVGHLTEEGILSILGRSDDVINRGGTKMPAAEIEERLLACVGVEDAAICIVQNQTGGGEVWAAMSPTGHSTSKSSSSTSTKATCARRRSTRS
jgi:acyl-coenzyme A synthetase/AMP-(fatty) acid ligase